MGTRGELQGKETHARTSTMKEQAVLWRYLEFNIAKIRNQAGKSGTKVPRHRCLLQPTYPSNVFVATQTKRNTKSLSHSQVNVKCQITFKLKQRKNIVVFFSFLKHHSYLFGECVLATIQPPGHRCLCFLFHTAFIQHWRFIRALAQIPASQRCFFNRMYPHLMFKLVTYPQLVVPSLSTLNSNLENIPVPPL